MRRERNKLAAARCRKRRLDHTMALQQEVDLWEDKKQGIQNEIRQLQKEKEELEVLLETHRTGPSCKHRRTAGSGGSNLPSFCGVRAPPAKNNVQPVIKQELQESDDSYSSESENNHLDASFDMQQHLAPAAHRSLLLTQQQPQLQPQQPQSAPHFPSGGLPVQRSATDVDGRYIERNSRHIHQYTVIGHPGP